EQAARRLRWERRDLGPQPLSWPLTPSWPGDELVSVHLGEGLPPSGWTRLDPVGERLEIPAGRGPRTVLLAWSEVTGQQVKRSAAGAEGPVVDHLSATAVRHHLDVVGGALLSAVPRTCSAPCSATASGCTAPGGPARRPSRSRSRGGTARCPGRHRRGAAPPGRGGRCAAQRGPAHLLGSVFSDSLEVYDAGWTAALPEQFRQRRGYDLLPVLHLLEVDAPGAEQVREDYGLTLSE